MTSPMTHPVFRASRGLARWSSIDLTRSEVVACQCELSLVAARGILVREQPGQFCYPQAATAPDNEPVKVDRSSPEHLVTHTEIELAAQGEEGPAGLLRSHGLGAVPVTVGPAWPG